MDEFPNPSKPIKVTGHLLSQAVELTKRDETDLYEALGLSSTLWETLQGADLVPFRTEGIEERPLSKGIQNMLYSLKTRELELPLLREDVRLAFVREGKAYFAKHKRKLYRKICVEKEACKWSKEILGDTKSLLAELIPLVGIALGITVPAIIVTIAIMIVKWGIIKFCNCSKAKSNVT